MPNNPAQVEPVEGLVEELRFLSDARQQMGYDRAGAAMDRAVEALTQASEREAKLVAENERLFAAGNAQLEAKIKEAAEAKLWFEKAQEWKAENERLRAGLSTIGGGAVLARTMFEDRVKERKGRLTWWAVNVLQRALSACSGHACLTLIEAGGEQALGGSDA